MALAQPVANVAITNQSTPGHTYADRYQNGATTDVRGIAESFRATSASTTTRPARYGRPFRPVSNSPGFSVPAPLQAKRRNCRPGRRTAIRWRSRPARTDNLVAERAGPGSNVMASGVMLRPMTQLTMLYRSTGRVGGALASGNAVWRYAGGGGGEECRVCALGERHTADSTGNVTLALTTGPQGATGATGAQGPMGTPGATGPAGAAGAQGPAGATGLTGAQGATGPAGPIGATGATGPGGATGAAGPVGATGAASTVPGPAGQTGAAGATGAQGPTGLTGATGPTGSAGAVGAQGATGATGSTGASGIVPFYGSSGLITGVKCVQGNATTTTGGVWTMSFNAATFPGFPGFMAAPNVQAQAISTSALLAGLLQAQSQAPTAASVSGTVTLAGVGGLGGAGSTVQVRACGS